MSQSFSPPKSYMKIYFPEKANDSAKIVHLPRQYQNVPFQLNQHFPPARIEENLNYFLNRSKIPPFDQIYNVKKINDITKPHITQNFTSNEISNCSSDIIYQNSQHMHNIQMYYKNNGLSITNNNDSLVQNVPKLKNIPSMLSSDQRIDMRGVIKKNVNNKGQYFQEMPSKISIASSTSKTYKYNEPFPTNTKNYNSDNNAKLFNKNLECFKAFPNKLEKFRDVTKLVSKSMSCSIFNKKCCIKKNKGSVSSKKNSTECNLEDKAIIINEELNKIQNHLDTFNSLNNMTKEISQNITAIDTKLSAASKYSKNHSLNVAPKRKYIKRKRNSISSNIDFINNDNYTKIMKFDFDTKLNSNPMKINSVNKNLKTINNTKNLFLKENDNCTIDSHDFSNPYIPILENSFDEISNKSNEKYVKSIKLDFDTKLNISSIKTNSVQKNPKITSNTQNLVLKGNDKYMIDNNNDFSNPYTQLLEKRFDETSNKNEITDKNKKISNDIARMNHIAIKNIKRENSINEKKLKKKIFDLKDVNQRLFLDLPNIMKIKNNNEDSNFNKSYEETDVKPLQLDCINKLDAFKKSGNHINNISKHLASKTSAIKNWSQYEIGETFLQMESCLKLPNNISRCCECLKNQNVEASGCRFYSFRKLNYTHDKFLKVAGFPLPMEAEPDDVLLWMAEPELIFKNFIKQYCLTNIPKPYDLAEITMNTFDNVNDVINSANITESVKFSVVEEKEIQNLRDEVVTYSICNKNNVDSTYIDHKEQFCDVMDESDTKKINDNPPGYVSEETVSTFTPDLKHKLTDSSYIHDCNVSCVLDGVVKDNVDDQRTKVAADVARYILSNIGGRFCQLVEQEKMVSLKEGIVWRRSLDGVREMCDECRTTIFNMHWICKNCGFGICIDCYISISKLSKNLKLPNCQASKQQLVHDVQDLTPTQILPSDVLLALDDAVHEIEEQLKIKFECNCSRREEPISILKSHSNLIDNIFPYDSTLAKYKQILENLDHSEYRETFIEQMQFEDFNIDSQSIYNNTDLTKCSNLSPYSIINITSDVMNDKINGPLSIGVLRKAFRKFAHVPYSWLDYGRLLQLTSPYLTENIEPFQHMWRMGQPVIISNCQDRLDLKLWHPQSFINEYGHIANDLVDCASGTVIDGWTMSVFWNGFEKVKRRKKNLNGEPIILKLKDWPSTADFSEVLPSRFNNLMDALPLPEYSHRDGVYNLASRLPDHYVRPDLGPKMYSAYGTAINPKIGSTNLHLDISDAVNLMIYVGVPKDDVLDHELATLESMRDAGCCEATLNRVKQGEIPGALWHIYDPRDSPAIRIMLKKYAEEQGEPVEENSDPIHDQCMYLNSDLRKRLEIEYGVIGITIVQFIGDAVFIPAGAPHQVQNFHSCVKAAEDFVSPENLAYCFHLTQEFRNLSDSHSNHEDKLQVKNILYHSVKESVAVLKKLGSNKLC